MKPDRPILNESCNCAIDSGMTAAFMLFALASGAVVRPHHRINSTAARSLCGRAPAVERSSAEIGSAKKEKANHVSMTGLY
jgi:hypothetical protein